MTLGQVKGVDIIYFPFLENKFGNVPLLDDFVLSERDDSFFSPAHIKDASAEHMAKAALVQQAISQCLDFLQLVENATAGENDQMSKKSVVGFADYAQPRVNVTIAHDMQIQRGC